MSMVVKLVWQWKNTPIYKKLHILKTPPLTRPQDRAERLISTSMRTTLTICVIVFVAFYLGVYVWLSLIHI